MMSNNIKVRLLSFVLFSILVSCNEERVVYEYSMFRNDRIQFWRDTLPENTIKFMENNEFTTLSPDGDTVMNGKTINGIKVGNWNYKPNDFSTFTIDWMHFQSRGTSIEIIYPSSWTIIKDDSIPFIATFPTDSEIKDDKYFVVFSKSIDQLQMNLEEYWHFANQKLFTQDSVDSYFMRKFTRESRDYYFSTYSISRNNENISIFNFIGESDSHIYDVTYSSTMVERDFKYTIFLDMIKSLRIKNKMFFPPYNNVTYIRELEWPPQPKTNA